MNANRIFQLMKGSWRIFRTIKTKTDQMTGEGKAFFRDIHNNPKVLMYQEDLLLGMNNGDFHVSKEYVFRCENDKISVFFKEQPERFFYTLEFKEDKSGKKDQYDCVTAQASHLCVNDMYKARYEFENDERFKLIYQVNGPKKDYEMSTIYEKIIDSN